MKKTGYTIGFAVFALMGLAALLLCVMTLFTGTVDGLFVRERITVSSSAMTAKEGSAYVVQVSGRIHNEGDHTVRVDEVKLALHGENGTETKILEGFEIDARVSHDLFCEWTSSEPFENVDSVELVIDGQAHRISNSEGSFFSAETVILFAFCAVSAFLCVFFAKKRYYVYEEEKMAKEKID